MILMTSLGNSSVSKTSNSMNDRLKLMICGWAASRLSHQSSFVDGSKRFELCKVICYFHLVACEYHSRKGEEHPELWRSGDPREAVQHAQDVEEDVELMREPEEAVGLLADDRVREQEDYADHGVKHDA